MSTKTIPAVLFITDAMLGIVAFLLSFYLLSGAIENNPGILNILLSGAVINAAFFVFRLYSTYTLRNATQQVMNIGKGIALSILLFISVSYFFNITVVLDNPLLIVYYAAFGIVFIQLWRTFVMRPLHMYFAGRNLQLKNTLIIGAEYVGQMMAAKIDLHRLNGMRVVGFLDDKLDRSVNVFKDKKVLGRMKDVGEIIDAHNIAEVLYCFDNGNYSIFQEILEICNRKNIKMRIASPYFDVLSPGMSAEKIGISVSYDFYPYQSGLHYTVKRIVDIVLATLGVIVLMPLFLLIALAIKIDSPGPVLYVHTRLGKDGRPFRFYKFRSMFLDSDNDEERKEHIGKFINGNFENGNGSTKIVDKTKVTRVGAILRRFSLDELPQLFNVVKGDMSLVGPRPCLPYEWDEYDEWHKKRLSVIPGCTGLWQVTGRSEVGFNDMVILDLYYIQNASFELDTKLILRTIPVMLFGKGGE